MITHQVFIEPSAIAVALPDEHVVLRHEDRDFGTIERDLDEAVATARRRLGRKPRA